MRIVVLTCVSSYLLCGDKVRSPQDDATKPTTLYVCVCVLQQSNATSSNGTLPGVLPDQRIVVTSTGLQTDSSGDSTVNITGASAYDRISAIEDDAMGTNITSPYKRLVRCFTAIITVLLLSAC